MYNTSISRDMRTVLFTLEVYDTEIYIMYIQYK